MNITLGQTIHSRHNTRVMFVRYWVIYLFLHLIEKVSLQDPVNITGDVGGSVSLQCLYQEKVLKSEERNVFWRYNTQTKVYDIEKGNPSKKQDEKFRGRVESFPSQYVNGNFSLRLSNLTLTDEGQFSCFISNVQKKYKLTLLVRAPTTTPTTASTSKPTMNARSSSMRTQPEGIATFLIAVLEFFILHYI